MVLEVEVISREIVKPCSPTPDHLRRYQLSFLDQISPPFFMAMVFFYPADSSRFISHTEDISNKLKQSLSENLVRFYPLAGRVKEENEELDYIDCNDEGVPYIEGRVKAQLSDTIRDPLPIVLHKLYPYQVDDVKDLALAVQINFFDCGGLALTVFMSHKVADGLSYFHFVNSWAATARGCRDGADIVGPQFGSAALFPPRRVPGYKRNTGMVKENIDTRRFVFSASAIAALVAKHSNDSLSCRPTRVEALSAFLWTRYMAAVIKEDIKPNTIYLLLHSVNLRPRAEPPLPDHFFGNMSRFVMSVPSRSIEKEEGEISYDVVNPMRDAIRKVTGEYVKKLGERNGGNEHLDFLKDLGERALRGEVVPFTFTSLCRFPLYEADFGWGKPVWVGSGRRTYRNLVTFVDTRSGDGIQAWVNLTEADMAKFEKDKELLAFTTTISTS